MTLDAIQTAARIALPTFDGEQLTELIKKLVLLDSRWIPGEPGYSLYIRQSALIPDCLAAGFLSDRRLVVTSGFDRPYPDRNSERFGCAS